MGFECSQCHAPATADQRFCGECGGTVVSAGAASGFRPATVASAAPSDFQSLTARGQAAEFASEKGLPAGFEDLAKVKLAHGEVIKRTYPFVSVRKNGGSLRGCIVVTDARLIYRANSSNSFNRSTVSREIQLSDINGLGLVTRSGVSPIGIVGFMLTGVWVLAWLLAIILGWSGVLMGIWLAAIVAWGALSIVLGRVKHVLLVVYARSMDSSPVGFSGAQGGISAGFFALAIGLLSLGLGDKLLERLGIYDASDAASEADLEVTQAVYHDLGALILDLQSRGVLGE